ncbi:MAG: tetratricopeptide repeat protein [Planctomycetota bacterium]
MLIIILGAVISAEPVLASRRSSRSSSSRSSSRSSGSRQSSRSSSDRDSQSSRSSISSRSVSRPSSSSRGTIRSSRRIDSGSRRSFDIRSSRIYSPLNPQAEVSPSSVRSSGSRPSRRSDAPISSPGTTTDGTRPSRLTGHYDYPSTRRSYYHYHRDHYPSHRIFYWISWPDCCRPICYGWGPSFTFGYFWPYYHRRFVFISIGGYWPCYSYRRYYWYGWHPFCWYGCYPPEYVIAGNAYNYYYYNAAPQGEELNKAHKKFEQSAPTKPAEETQADRNFEAAVKAFDAGDYTTATAKFQNSMQLAPEDIVVPFAYVQALFADGEYPKAAEALRSALLKSSPQQEGVFYPRGLYTDESLLHEQIEQLSETVEKDPVNTRMRLLLGYQLLGMGELDEAARHLENARLSSHTNLAATLLIDVLEKNKKGRDSDTDSNQNQTEQPAEPAPADSKDKNTAKDSRKDIDLSAVAVVANKWLDEP